MYKPIDYKTIYNRNVVQSNLLSRNQLKQNDALEQGKREMFQMLSTAEKKIVLYLISLVDKKDTAFKDVELSVLELAKIIGLSECGGAERRKIKKAMEGLSDKRLWLFFNNENCRLAWLEKLHADKPFNRFKLKLSEEMRPYILQLKSSYTMAKYGYIVKLNKRFSIDIYMYLKSIEKRPDWVADPEFFRGLAKDNQYPYFSDIEKKVIRPSIDEINEKTDIYVTYTLEKTGKTVTGIKFAITKQSNDYIPESAYRDSQAGKALKKASKKVV